MRVEDIFFHDCEIVRVVEDPARNTLAFEVMYPVEWETNTFAPKTLVFSDVLRYEVHEGPFSGASTILDYTTEPDGERVRISMGTNAGKRAFSFSEVDLVDGHGTS